MRNGSQSSPPQAASNVRIELRLNKIANVQVEDRNLASDSFAVNKRMELQLTRISETQEDERRTDGDVRVDSRRGLVERTV